MQAALSGRVIPTGHSRSRPLATYFLMFAVIGVMFAEIFIVSQGLDLELFLNRYGLVADGFSWAHPRSYLTLLTFNFLHSGAAHFTGNAVLMLFASAAVEKHAGRRITLFIWLAGGVFAGLAHLMLFPDTSRSLVGASGAISALLGASVVIGWRWALPVKLWPERRVLFQIRLPVVTGFWVAMQLYGAIGVYNGTIANPTAATWVHLAGFAFGVLAAGALAAHRARTLDFALQRPSLTGSGD